MRLVHSAAVTALLACAALMAAGDAAAVGCSAHSPLIYGGPAVEVSLWTDETGKALTYNRTFLVRLPRSRDAAPLLIGVHGANQAAEDFTNGSNIDVASTAAGYVFAAPRALHAAICNCSVWGGTVTTPDLGDVLVQHVPAVMPPGNESEVPFLRGLIACMHSALSISLSGEMYTAGFSQGAKVATQLACTNLSTITGPAWAVRAAFIYGPAFVNVDDSLPGCAVKAPALLAVADALDIITPLCSYEPSSQLAPDVVFLTAWARYVARCSGQLPDVAWCASPTSAPGDNATLIRALSAFSWPGCSSTMGLLYTSHRRLLGAPKIPTFGHEWPGVMAELNHRDATRLMLDFFHAAVQSSPAQVLADTFLQPGSSLSQCNASAAWPCKDGPVTSALERGFKWLNKLAG